MPELLEELSVAGNVVGSVGLVDPRSTESDAMLEEDVFVRLARTPRGEGTGTDTH